MKIKESIKKNKQLFLLYMKINNGLLGNNRISVKGNIFNAKNARIKNTRITVKGKNNTIEIDDGSYLVNCNITILGNNNRLVIGKKVISKGVLINIEDNNNLIIIQDNTTIEKNTELAAIEGTSIMIGKDCMLSSDIRICTGDSHSLVDLNGKRVNPSQNIVIGNHVSIGVRAMINKGIVIADHCTIGSLSMLAGHKFEEPYSVIVGIPAKVIKCGIDWSRERL